MGRIGAAVLLVSLVVLELAGANQPRPDSKTLTLYFIDVEGGQSALIVTPTRETLLIDTGFPGAGAFESRPGDPRRARDANRIVAAMRDASVSRIDYLLITHFHPDHVGGVVELAQLVPIRTFIDHGTVDAGKEPNPANTSDAFRAYVEVRAKGVHLQPKPGEELPITGIAVTVISSAASVIQKAVRSSSQPNVACEALARSVEEPRENARSTGIVAKFGTFRFLDVGDLNRQPLFDLVCPSDRVGPVDVYLVPEHGGADPSALAALNVFKPRVAILNNGVTRGASPETFAALRQVTVDVWQLDRSTRQGVQNFADEQIANLDERTGHWIKLIATEEGSFAITNGRTGMTKRYLPLAKP
jgi:beta-lactamase superfamily II metal-dependent hydrolase